MPYQAFEAAGFEQDLPRNEINGTMYDRVFQCTNTLNVVGVIPLFCQISDGSTWYLGYWVHTFELGVHGTLF